MAAEAGLKPFEVDAMDLVDVLIQVEGHEMRERNELIRMRYLAYTIHAHSMAKHKAKSPEKFMPLYWEKNSGMPVFIKLKYQCLHQPPGCNQMLLTHLLHGFQNKRRTYHGQPCR